jgi:hypothetical protein
MNAASSSIVDAASGSSPGTVQGAAAVSVLKKALDLQASMSAQLLGALPQPALASTGIVGTQLNAFA